VLCLHEIWKRTPRRPRQARPVRNQKESEAQGILDCADDDNLRTMAIYKTGTLSEYASVHRVFMKMINKLETEHCRLVPNEDQNAPLYVMIDFIHG
jgi:hypothetical protein